MLPDQGTIRLSHCGLQPLTNSSYPVSPVFSPPPPPPPHHTDTCRASLLLILRTQDRRGKTTHLKYQITNTTYSHTSYTYIHTHTHTHTNIQTHTNTNIQTHKHTHACTHTHMHACTHTNTRMHAHTHTCMHAHTQTHTHTANADCNIHTVPFLGNCHFCSSINPLPYKYITTGLLINKTAC